MSGLAALALLAVVVLSIGFGIFQSQAALRLEREQKLTRDALEKAEAPAVWSWKQSTRSVANLNGYRPRWPWTKD